MNRLLWTMGFYCLAEEVSDSSRLERARGLEVLEFEVDIADIVLVLRSHID